MPRRARHAKSSWQKASLTAGIPFDNKIIFNTLQADYKTGNKKQQQQQHTVVPLTGLYRSALPWHWREALNCFCQRMSVSSRVEELEEQRWQSAAGLNF
ncbi:unnamed protein product [Ceratitis capitata]|uniref:(Mediterranean fruit fly) hypothetical protein n=1 Tax=Ceratitis capitata TaxID=7213 RepID=A0A811VA70_CERCA|nr:unnamed protein product [Ceratitis capitata]